MEVRAKREGCYSELKIHFEIANFVSLTTLILWKKIAKAKYKKQAILNLN